jgi:hypothetical protein
MISLNQIVHSMLLHRGYPIHMYMKYLVYATAGLRELHYDTLKIINTATYEGALEYDLPCGYLDFVRIGYFQHPCKEYAANIENCDCYGNSIQDGAYWKLGHSFGVWGYEVVSIGEGKLKVKHKGKLLLEYLSDFSTLNNATRISPYAQKAIEDYCDWQYKKYNRAYNPREVLIAKAEFDNSHARLRSRLSPLTLDDIRLVLRRGANTPIKL